MELTVLQAAILGAVQGVTEFLPISSSGHIILAADLFGYQEPSQSFAIAVHMGTLVAVALYFWREWLVLFGVRRGASGFAVEPLVLWRLLVVATLPVVVVGVLFGSWIEVLFRSPVIIAGLVALGGVVLYYSDSRSPARREITAMQSSDALKIGLAQAVALVPGVSRSGATMSVARLYGFTRETAARFSFLMAAPAITGACVLLLLRDTEILWSSATMAGMLSACVSALLTMWLFLAAIRRFGFSIYMWYGIGVFVVFLMAQIVR